MAADGGRSTPAKRVLDALGSLLTALLVFGATPAVLSIVVGNPLAHGLGYQWSVGARVALTGLALVAWLAWVICCTQLARAVVQHVRRKDVNVPAGALLTERIAVRIAAGVLSLMALLAPLVLNSGAGASNVAGAGANVGMTAPTAVPPVAALAATDVAQPAIPAAVTYVVRPGDSLWSIAATQLGDGDDWPAIAALNLGRTMPGGLRFVDPNRIYAGWDLQIPDLRAPVTPAQETAAHPTRRPTDRRVPLPTETLVARLFERVPVPASDQHRRTEPTSRAPSHGRAGPGGPNLPELAALGIGAMGCAALARRARHMRLLRQVTSDDRPPDPQPSARAIDTDVLLARFDGVPALRAFEAANYRLARAMTDAGGFSGAVRIRAVCVGAAGVDFWLAQPGQPAPSGFTLSADGGSWQAAPEAFTALQGSYPYLPIVLPIGEDDAGTWLVPLERGSCLPLVGEAADDLWRAARAVQAAWSWTDVVLITEDPQLVRDEALVHDAESPPTGARQILYCGDPASLPDAVAQSVAVVTLSNAAASDVTVVVDRRAASIHPLGRTVRPHLMQGDTATLVGELVAALPLVPVVMSEHLDDHKEPVAEDRISSRPRVHVNRVESEDHVDRAVDVSAFPSPGTVEVKLLTPSPRIEGMRAALPANRARRSVELVAYLALHQRDEITSDRLRTRVLGSSDADAASKTLFNIATAARSALGTDAHGVPLFPSGSRTGHYRVTEEVSVDVHRATTLAAVGSATEDPDAAMSFLRAALSLIEGEPLANALSGYAWWEAEGHGARIAAVLVNAASDLAALAVDAGLFDLAQWGLGQARMVDPYSEAISRVAMQVAAAAGDADRLRREWRDCQRRMDDLDPGSTPSPRTERLYGELAQRVLVGAADTSDQ